MQMQTRAIDSRDKWLDYRDEYLVVMKLEMVDHLNSKSNNYVQV